MMSGKSGSKSGHYKQDEGTMSRQKLVSRYNMIAAESLKGNQLW